ncbi:MAG: VWA domain-containing protein [Pseudomonadota bacterium]
MARDLSKTGSSLPKTGTSSGGDISAFLQAASRLKKNEAGNGGLVFAMDATMSRQHTWDQAQHIQAEMFGAVEKTGGLDVQLVYFRGFGECRASRWVNKPAALRDLMSGIDCRGGQTQIGKVLSHVRKEAAKKNPLNGQRSRVDALVYVGDAMEEQVDALCQKAGELGLLKVPCFMFLEGHDRQAELAFREVARLSGGAFMRFGPGAAAKLADLLKAVARYAAGGRVALEKAGGSADRLLLEQLK